MSTPRRLSWRCTKNLAISHAFTVRAHHSLCGFVPRAGTILSWRGEPDTIECKECAGLAAAYEAQHAV